MDRMGIVWDAYTMERWYDPVRTDLMEQQSAWEQGKPWVKLNDMGTNLKQMVSGPEGNPLGVFSGKKKRNQSLNNVLIVTQKTDNVR